MSEEKQEKYSYSKLSCFEQCPYKYKLVYLDKHFIDCPSIATEFGTLVHHVEELIGKALQNGEEPDYPTLIKEFDEKIIAIKHAYTNDFYALDKSGRTYEEKALYYRNTAIYRLSKRLRDNPNLSIECLEKEFYLHFGEYLFHGFIDRVFYDKRKDEYIIEDIKTYPKAIQPKDLKTPLQHVVYSLALNSIGIKKIRCTYDLPLCDITQKVDTDYLTRGIRKLEGVFDDIKYSDFAPNPTPLCHWCLFSGTYPNQPEEAKGLCPYYCNWTKVNKDFRSHYRWCGVKRHPQILEAFQKEVDSK